MPELKELLPECNFITDYTRAHLLKSGGHREFKHAAAVTLLSIAADRRIQIPLSFGDVYTNVWGLILGLSSISGKSTAFDEMKEILKSAAIGEKLPDTFSREALIECLADTPQAYILNDEVDRLLRDMKKAGGYLNGFSADLCTYYDNPDQIKKQLTKRGNGQASYEIFDLYISLLWGTTPANFERAADPSDLESGLMARLLLYKPEGAPEYIDVSTNQGFRDDLTQIAKRLKQIFESVHQFQTLQMKPSEKSLKAYNDWQRKYRNDILKQSEGALTLSGRLRVYCFKLAALYYLGSPEFISDAENLYNSQIGGNLHFESTTGKPEVFLGVLEIPDLYFEIAMQHVRDYFMQVSCKALTETIEMNTTNSANAVINALKKAAEMTLTRSQLLRRLAKYIHAAELDRLIDLLEDEAIISRQFDNEPDKRGRRRNTEIITLINEKEVNS